MCVRVRLCLIHCAPNESSEGCMCLCVRERVYVNFNQSPLNEAAVPAYCRSLCWQRLGLSNKGRL